MYEKSCLLCLAGKMKWPIINYTEMVKNKGSEQMYVSWQNVGQNCKMKKFWDVQTQM